MMRLVPSGYGIAVVALFVNGAAASESDTEFAFDLFSDIAPILALFGEDFATQFASESLTWIDHLVFAMVPLGILTMITGAIRVQGPRIARSFIGRARENRALAEIDLMSSTSGEVCELFNGRSIIRAMGKPKIAQFLVFPEQYEELETQYSEFDKRGRILMATPPADQSCGIHSLTTAVLDMSSEDGKRRRLMKCVAYHSQSYELVRKYLRRAKRFLGIDKTTEDVESPDGRLDEYFEPPGPPNLQLNLSSDQFEKALLRKRHELFLAAVFAVFLQSALITIAAVTVIWDSVRESLEFEPTGYGFSCYVVGSGLLAFGMGLCSLAVEQSTSERAWRVLEDEKEPKVEEEELKQYPRLIWLQQSQTVSDQSFDPYVILAGPKRHVVTSSRIEDTQGKSQGADARRGSVGEMKPIPVGHEDSGNTTTWEILTTVGVFAAGGGFVAQFVGLRGLAFPCSIAQLIGIFLMALVRALIRRRLGLIPGHTRALEDYELDFLATHITFCPKLRNFHKVSDDNGQYLGDTTPPDFLYQWRVRLSEAAQDSPFFFRSPKEMDMLSCATPELDRQTTSHTQEGKSQGLDGFIMSVIEKRFGNASSGRKKKPYFEPASSQQLLRVRERLGDLCGWESKASESALALVKSIELFLDTFLTQASVKRLDCAVEALKPISSVLAGEQADLITIPIKRSAETGKWEVDLGKVEATLSLWMATIEAQLSDEKKDPKGSSDLRTRDWRRAESGKGMRYRFCRILGDDFKDGVLKRDLSWWVDELLADQSDPHDFTGQQVEKPVDYDSEYESMLDAQPQATWLRNPSRDGDIKLVIGFNGRPKEADHRRESTQDVARELALVSSAYLPTILAQHLFTSFMWTVVDQLPGDCLQQGISSSEEDVEIDGRHKFVLYEFLQTWRRPTLRHRQLTKVVRHMETYGLGSIHDILLCMVPALSFKDLLPNNAMLKLMPQVGVGQSWLEAARAYHRLLTTSVGTATEENYCYAVVTTVMDFLYLACEPYDRYILPPTELYQEIVSIVRILLSPKFAPVVTKLAPVYELQQRRQNFVDIFVQYGSDCIESFTNDDIEADVAFLEGKLGFGKGHQLVYRAIKRERKQARLSVAGLEEPPVTSQKDQGEIINSSSFGQDGKEAVRTDIFGWTPLHLACFADAEDVFDQVLEAVTQKNDQPIHRFLDTLNRSPVHIAALAGKEEVLELILGNLATEDRKEAVTKPGIDNMTPLHLATYGGNLRIVDRVITESENAPGYWEDDIWGRGPLHIAASFGYDKIGARLLERPRSYPEKEDYDGRTALDYLLKSDDDLRDDGEQEGAEEHLEMKRRKRTLFMDLAKATRNREFRGKDGKSFLHHAVELADEKIVADLLHRGFNLELKDSEDNTPLHRAVLAGRLEIALALIKGLDGNPPADITAIDKFGATTIMFAAQKGLVEVVDLILELDPTALNAVDVDMNTLLHYAIDSNDIGIVELAITKGSDPTAQNAFGRTAAHEALNDGRDIIAAYLLNFDTAPEYDQDTLGETMLLTACRTGCLESVRVLVKKWPKAINAPDYELGQTPLGYACDIERIDIIKLLLACDGIDPNIAALKRSKWTPLHTAAILGNSKIITLLLSHKATNVDIIDGYPSAVLQAAIFRRRLSCIRAILLHSRVSDEARIKALRIFHPHIPLDGQDMIDIAQDVLNRVGVLPDADIIQLVETHAKGVPANMVLLPTYVKQALKQGEVWKQLRLPCHIGARTGNIEIVRTLVSSGADPITLDENNWSCADVALACGHAEIAEELERIVEERRPRGHKKPGFATPSTLSIPPALQEIVTFAACAEIGHDRCALDGLTFATLAERCSFTNEVITSKCPMPPRSANRFFYFEVTVVEESVSGRAISIGFADGWTRDIRRIGWDRGSWSYSSDDGYLNVEGRWKPSWSSDFGPAGKFGKGDVVGVGLDLENGEGFVTLNGALREVGEAFEGELFKYGIMYPCIHIDTKGGADKIQLKVNWGLSEDHPFVYMGPFPPFPGSS
ncbi:hypothetical protein B0T14DRAFT_494379 [Immersiella caudata]|uniref:B30.2/SPRY domain-containing protein n=1 Tax=Immersiella caudata TaxID=314043 RepID=A0AA39WWF8_9PEZI|nr:hypothetical protein B0T14DRAFT_494379 [Immersiella caudata]